MEAHRSMRLAKREVREPERLRAIVESCQVVRIGAADEEGMFIVPMNFGYDWKEEQGECRLTLYLHSAKEGRKAEAFGSRCQVAFEMDGGHQLIEGSYTCAYSYAYQSIMGKGILLRVEEEEEKRYCLKRLMAHLNPRAEIEFSDAMVNSVAVYKLTADHFTGKERRPK